MRLVIELHRMTALKKELLKSDMEHTKWILQDELQKTISKLKGDRNLCFKIVRLLSKITTLTNTTVESFTIMLENLSLKGTELFNYDISYQHVSDIDLAIEVDDTYFDLFKMIPLAGRFLNAMFESRKGFVKRVEKSIKEDYTDDYTIKEE